MPPVMEPPMEPPLSFVPPEALLDDAQFFETLVPPCAKVKQEGKQRPGRPPKRQLVGGAELLPQQAVAEMTLEEKRAAYQRMYGQATTSGNTAWLSSALTHHPAAAAAKEMQGRGRCLPRR